MPIRYRCPECRQLLSISTRMAGRRIDCPSCQAEHSVPTLEAAGLQERLAPAESAAPVEKKPEIAPAAPPSAQAGVFALPPAISPQSGLAPPGIRSAQTSPEGDDDDEAIFRGFQRESDEMDLTPMVDCVFLLLIFFMITASFSVQKTIEVPPPDPEKKGAAVSVKTLDDLERTSVIVRIDERNTIFVDDVQLGDPDTLADVLRDKMYAEQKNELVLEAHARAFHQSVVTVVDAANEVQFQKVRLATTPGTEPD